MLFFLFAPIMAIIDCIIILELSTVLEPLPRRLSLRHFVIFYIFYSSFLDRLLGLFVSRFRARRVISEKFWSWWISWWLARWNPDPGSLLIQAVGWVRSRLILLPGYRKLAGYFFLSSVEFPLSGNCSSVSENFFGVFVVCFFSPVFPVLADY